MVAGGHIENFQQLISGNDVFEVPDFQRNYSWENKQVEELYTDIIRTAQSPDSHFLGSLILLRNGGPRTPVQVVDGQQRLTTIFLLIAVIRDKAFDLPVHSVPGGPLGAPIEALATAQSLLVTEGSGAEYRFVAHPIINSLVKTHIFHYPDAARQPLPIRHFNYSLALRKAHKKLTHLVNTSLAGITDVEDKVRFLASLLRTIKFDLKVLNVSSDSNSEAYEIFMTLNSRGMPLGPADLVKSEIFKHLTKGFEGRGLEERASNLTSDWQMLIQNLDAGDTDQFLRHFLVSKYKGPLTGKKVFDRVSKIINGTHDFPADPKAESQVLLSELMISSGLYSQLLEGRAAAVPGVEASLKLLSELADSYRIFLLPVIDLRISLDLESRRELVRLCEVLTLRWVLTGGNAQKLEDLMQDLSLMVRDGASFDELKRVITIEIPKDDSVKSEFEETVDSAPLVRLVLHRINSVWDSSGLIPYNSSNIHVEHIAPDKSTEHWKSVLFPNDDGVDRAVEYDAAVQLWGNKTILDSKINMAIKQKPFLEKARGVGEPEWAGYVHSQLAITSDLGFNLTHWDKNEIALRNKWIADCFLNIWAIEPDFSQVRKYTEWRMRYQS